MFSKKHRTKGNILSEYLLIGSLILVATVGSSLVFAENLEGLFGGLKEDMADRISNSKKTGELKEVPTTLEAVIDDSEAIVEQFIEEEVQVTETIMTAGANGSQDQSVIALYDLVDNTTLVKDIPKEQISILIQLANQAFLMAKAHKILHDVITSKQSADVTVNFNGKTMTALALSEMLGSPLEWTAYEGYGDNRRKVKKKSSGELYTGFDDLYREVKKSGLLENRQMAKIIKSASRKVLNAAEMADVDFWEDVRRNKRYGNQNSNSNGNSSQDKADETEDRGNDICSAGNGNTDNDDDPACY